MDATKREYRAWEYDSFLPADWRALDAQRLVDGQKPEWSATDPAIRKYARYLRARRTGAGRGRLGLDGPAIDAAHQIAEQQDVRRWEIESRVLADQAVGEIANRCGATPEAVRWFETLFFDARCRLAAWAWIDNIVIGDGLCCGFDDGELGPLWMAFGFHGGAAIIDELVRAFRAVWVPGEPATIDVYFREPCVATLELRAMIAAHCIPLSQATALEFTKMRLQLDMTRSPHRATAAKKKSQEAIIRLFRAAPWKDRKALSPSKQMLVAEAMAGHGELSLPEHSTAGTGDCIDPPEPPQPVSSAV